MKKIEEVLNNIRGIEFGERGGEIYYERGSVSGAWDFPDFEQECKDDLYTLIKNEVIGKDEKIPDEDEVEHMALTLDNLEMATKAVEFHAENKLRRNQRKALDKLFGKGNND